MQKQGTLQQCATCFLGVQRVSLGSAITSSLSAHISPRKTKLFTKKLVAHLEFIRRFHTRCPDHGLRQTAHEITSHAQVRLNHFSY